ncbi:MAG: 2-hydroxyhepta-2,4-diene-1,7-dioate isomerase, partial [Sorangium cellulosum]
MSNIRRFGRFCLRDGTVGYARIEREKLYFLATAPWIGEQETGLVALQDEAKRLCPVEPRKIMCIGRNYRAHALEMGVQLPQTPLLFLKPPSSLLAPEGTVLLPPESQRVEHEAELGVVIGKGGRRIELETAIDHVFAYTAVGDITARDLQRSDGQWSRAKGFDTFCPVGPTLVTGLDPSNLQVVGRVNGEERQNGNTSDMLFDVAKLVSHLSQAMTLEPGD